MDPSGSLFAYYAELVEIANLCDIIKVDEACQAEVLAGLKIALGAARVTEPGTQVAPESLRVGLRPSAARRRFQSADIQGQRSRHSWQMSLQQSNLTGWGG